MPPIVLLGEAWGENEAKLRSAFVGPTGAELLTWLSEAGIIELTGDDREYISKYWRERKPEFLECVWNLHPEVHRTNVFNLHPPGNKLEALCGPKAEAILGYPSLIKGKHIHSSLQPELDRLADELVELDPNLIIGFGNTPLWALTGKTGISKLRGTTMGTTHCVDGFKLLPTYHPAAVLRQWELRPVAVIDCVKASRESAFPEIRRPEREIWIEPTLEDIKTFLATKVDKGRPVAVDIETSGTQITCIGFAPNGTVSIVIPFFDARAKGRSYWPDRATEVAVWEVIRNFLEDDKIKKTFQNGLYDIAFIYRTKGISVRGADHDTMLCHHALQPESLKGLAFLGSIYSDEGAWKQDRKGETTIKRDA